MPILSTGTSAGMPGALSGDAERIARELEQIAAGLEELRQRVHSAGMSDWNSAAAVRFRDRLLERERSLLRTEGLVRTAAAGVAAYARSLSLRESLGAAQAAADAG
ncbi:hypothetical protein KIH31_17735 [Paenarthrobacter sp. DKR-5]|uniref:hypothetical protein n=1 Tax=Paenarthrobacter sp. DKR-5 TaxID=2835535 RepID=UPI001BDD8501|nr:hypothetical protein [Paenarthrobacter sp. DKR-5]MBT1004430.1 hypothetical protein [Paenarthrobacter sp. DKR-5]